MELSHVGRALTTAVIFVFAGCGGAGTTASVPSVATAQSVAHHATGSDGDLLYVAKDTFDTYSYPKLQQGQKFRFVRGYLDAGPNLSNGDMCFVSLGVMGIYHHGTSEPFEELRPVGTSDSGFTDCAFDPTNGNIAASLSSDHHQPILNIFSPSSKGVSYSDPDMDAAWFVAYDANGNLFVDGDGRTSGWLLDELPKGSNALVELSLSKQIGPMLSLQWDGAYMTVMDSTTIYRFSVSGSNATVIGETTLNEVEKGHFNTAYEIAGDTVIGIAHEGKGKGQSLALWRYPKGGNPYKDVRARNVAAFALSVAPTQSRIRK